MKINIQILRIVMISIAIASAIAFVPWVALKAWVTPLPSTIQEQLEEATELGLTGIIIYVDQPSAHYSAGWQDRENRIAADPQALFKIASISKLYIAAAAAKLINEQMLSKEDVLADRLPVLQERIENAESITLEMLLQHRSGIPNFVDDEKFDWGESQTDTAKYLDLILDQPSDFKPDSRYAYSNTNYLLIGDILDKVLGYPHQLYIEKEILAPLGLSQTYLTLSNANLDNVVSGYHHSFEQDFKKIDYIMPGGSMVATAKDVAIFLRALIDGSLLSEDEQRVYSSIYDYEHTGWVLGYQSIARYHQEIDAVVIQFVNSTGGNSEMISPIIYNRIVKLVKKQTVLDQ